MMRSLPAAERPVRFDVNYCLIAAYQAVNARVAQCLIVSLLAAPVALRSGADADGLLAEWLLLGFPVLALPAWTSRFHCRPVA